MPLEDLLADAVFLSLAASAREATQTLAAARHLRDALHATEQLVACVIPSWTRALRALPKEEAILPPPLRSGSVSTVSSASSSPGFSALLRLRKIKYTSVLRELLKRAQERRLSRKIKHDFSLAWPLNLEKVASAAGIDKAVRQIAWIRNNITASCVTDENDAKMAAGAAREMRALLETLFEGTFDEGSDRPASSPEPAGLGSSWVKPDLTTPKLAPAAARYAPLGALKAFGTPSLVPAVPENMQLYSPADPLVNAARGHEPEPSCDSSEPKVPAGGGAFTAHEFMGVRNAPIEVVLRQMKDGVRLRRGVAARRVARDSCFMAARPRNGGVTTIRFSEASQESTLDVLEVFRARICISRMVWRVAIGTVTTRLLVRALWRS